MRILIALCCGALFGLGLSVSDMIDPARVLAFLDVGSGAWDPTLAFVMGGAMIPMFIAWMWAGRMTQAIDGSMFPAVRRGIDPRLLGGGVLFGAGWGLVGFCPGPALSAIGLGGWPVWAFVAAMIAGNLLADLPVGGRARTA